jgi:hypothetical protein
MSVTQTLASDPTVQKAGSLTTEFKKKFDDSLAEIRTHKIALGVFIGLAALAVAVVVLTIAAWVIVPLTIEVGSTLLLSTLIIATISVTLIAIRNLNLSISNDNLQRIFGDLLKSDRGKLSEEKMKLFEKYGEYCTKLEHSLSDLTIGVELGVFFDWLLDEKRDKAIQNPEVRQFLQSLNTEENRKYLKPLADLYHSFYQKIKRYNLEVETLSKITARVPKNDKEKAEKEKYLAAAPAKIKAMKEKISELLSRVDNGFVFISGFDREDNIPQDQLCTRKQVVDLIKSCPNLKKIYPSPAMEQHSDIREAYTKIGAVPDAFYLDLANKYKDDWQRDFPGIKV